MQGHWKLVAVLVVAALVGSVSAPTFAAAPDAVPGGFVLPQGDVLAEEEMADIHGEGLVSAAVGAAIGATAGYAGYVVDYVWDVYVDGDEDRDFDWSDAGKAAAEGAVVGAISLGLAAFLP